MYISLIIIILLIQTINLPIERESQLLNEIIENLIERKEIEELSDDIVILHVNDVHCGINDTIGYDGLVLYRDEMKRKYKNVITVDVGDHVQGGVIGSLSQGSAIIELMNKIGFDVVTLGNHEFDYGLEQLYKFEKNITSHYICSNFCYNKNKSVIFNPYKIVNSGNKTIAFIGVVTPLTFSKTFLCTVRDENNEPIYDFLAENNSQLLYKNLQNYINEVRNNSKVDYVILLTHIGMNIEEYTSNGLLSNLEGVTAILDGHTHKIYNTTSKDKNGNNITISQTGTKLQTIGKLILKKDGSIISEIIYDIPEPINKTNAIKINRASKERWVDSETLDFINDLWGKYEDELNIFVGYSDYDFIINSQDANDSHSISCRYNECTLGNLISDAIRYTGNGDLTITNGGAIRNNLKKGNITRGNIIEVLPWFDNIVVKELPGQAILDALEFGVANLPKSSGRFPQVSGITFDVNVNFSSTVLTDPQGMFINVTGKRRVSNVKINGVDLNLTKKYKTSIHEFIAKGGDGYSMIANYEVVNESLFTDTDALLFYITNNLKSKIPEEYSKLQGRINIFNKTETYIPIVEEKDQISDDSILSIIIGCVAGLTIFIYLLFYYNSKFSFD